MPLSELWRFATGKLESDQQRSFPAVNSSSAGNDLVELVWENGQIMIHNQSNRGTGGLGLNSIPSNTNRICDAMAGQSTTSRIGKFDGVESILDDMSSVVPSGELDLSQDDEMVPWLNYPIGDGLPQDYVSDLLPEISGVTGNGMSAQNSFVSMEKRSNCDGNVNNLSSGGKVSKALFSSSKARPWFSWLAQHCQSSDAMGSTVSNFTSNNTLNSHNSAASGNTPQGKAMVNESARMEMERPDMGLPTSNSNLFNFPYFSRPVIITKANPQYCDGATTSVSSGVVKIDVKDRGSASSDNCPPKSPFVGPRKDIDFGASSSKIALVDSRKQVAEESNEIQLPERAKNICKEPPVKNEKPAILGHVACPTKEILDGDRNVEPTFISSSVGSGYSADRVSNEHSHNLKRTFHDIEESECRSDDIETESVGVTKATPARLGSSSKRSRAAEVHNLSERRRRDRINEKMRALQELIPNCNKVDKASMLDEAIEYLKTLQLQVQIMSMGAGLCMPSPMILPPGMQHLHPPHLPPFAPMGFGYGMGMGFSMGIRDMGSGSPGYPIFPVPHAQVAHFPPPMSGPSNFQPIPFPNLPVYGHPSLGLPNSVPRAPAVPVAAPPPVASAGTVLCGLRSGNPNEGPDSSAALNSVDPLTNKNTQPKFSAEAGNPNQKPDQIEVTNDVLDKPATVHGSQKASDARASVCFTTTTTQTDITKETDSGCD